MSHQCQLLHEWSSVEPSPFPRFQGNPDQAGTPGSTRKRWRTYVHVSKSPGGQRSTTFTTQAKNILKSAGNNSNTRQLPVYRSIDSWPIGTHRHYRLKRRVKQSNNHKAIKKANEGHQSRSVTWIRCTLYIHGLPVKRGLSFLSVKILQ